MVTIAQVQTGFAKFLDMQLASAFSGWQRAVVLCGGTLIARNLPNLAEQYKTHPIMALSGVYNAEDGTYDIDALHEGLAAHIGDSKIPITLPGLGTIKLGREDVDTLCRYIKEA